LLISQLIVRLVRQPQRDRIGGGSPTFRPVLLTNAIAVTMFVDAVGSV